MEAATNLARVRACERPGAFEIDTSFVLFFMAVEMGLNLGNFGFDTVFLAGTLAAVAVLPYFIAPETKPEFGNWVLGRGLIVGFALVLGLMFRQTLGVVLPESFRYLPMTLLILTAVFSCCALFYWFFKLRLSK